MPTCECECTSCGHRFEKFQWITARPVRRCPSCGKRAKWVLGAGCSLMFKGSGFYVTDYRSESYKKAARADGERHGVYHG